MRVCAKLVVWSEPICTPIRGSPTVSSWIIAATMMLLIEKLYQAGSAGVVAGVDNAHIGEEATSHCLYAPDE